MQEQISAQTDCAAEESSCLGAPGRLGGVGWAGLVGAAYSEVWTVWRKLPEFQGLHF